MFRSFHKLFSFFIIFKLKKKTEDVNGIYILRASNTYKKHMSTMERHGTHTMSSFLYIKNVCRYFKYLIKHQKYKKKYK